jgi:hypothetical protein
MAERGRSLTPGAALLGLTELNRRFTELQKEFAELRDQLNVFENWNSEIKTMYGKLVSIATTDGNSHSGVLAWSDRYNLCIERVGVGRAHRQIISKGAMVSVELAE